MLIKKGSKGTDVSWAKGMLTELKFYENEAPDEFGLMMDYATRAFQTQYKLKIDGIIGPETEGKLRSFETQPVFGTVTGQGVNIRVGPSTDYQSVGKLDRGTQLEVLDYAEPWSRVRYQNKELYIFTQYLIVVKDLVTEFVAFVKSQVNVGIYVWGAQGQEYGKADPNTANLTVAFINSRESDSKHRANAIKMFEKRKAEGHAQIRAYDCSGLIMYHIFNVKKLVKQDYNSRGIYSTLCTVITRNQLQPGDLVFKHNGTKIHHVGIYVGNNRVVHAKGRNYGVIEESIFNTTWNRFGRLKCLAA